MKFHNFKPYAKYGLFLILIISLAGTAYADSNLLVCFNGSTHPENTTGGSPTSVPTMEQAATDFNGQETESIIVDNSGHGNNGKHRKYSLYSANWTNSKTL